MEKDGLNSKSRRENIIRIKIMSRIMRWRKA